MIGAALFCGFLLLLTIANVYANTLVSEEATEDQGLQLFWGIWAVLGCVVLIYSLYFLFHSVVGGVVSICAGGAALGGALQFRRNQDGRSPLIFCTCWLAIGTLCIMLPFLIPVAVFSGYGMLMTFLNFLITPQNPPTFSAWSSAAEGVVSGIIAGILALFFALSVRMLKCSAKISERRTMQIRMMYLRGEFKKTKD